MKVGRTRQKIGIGYYGKVPPVVWPVLEQTYAGSIYLQSDFARSNAVGVSMAASLGWITTVHIDGTEFLPFWVITAEGLHAYRNRRDTV